MSISSLFVSCGKLGYSLLSYFFKGPKVDASLTHVISRQIPKGVSYLNPINQRIHVGEAINQFEFEVCYELTIKNSSKHPAYNIKFINDKIIFSSNEELEQLESLQPNESKKIQCSFLTKNIHAKGQETQKYLEIPDNIIDVELVISYQNDARTTFYTKYKVNEKQANNTYSFFKPQKQTKQPTSALAIAGLKE